MKKNKKIKLNIFIFSLVCILLTVDFLASSFFKINAYEKVFRYTSVLLIFILFILNRNISINEILVLILFIILFIQNSEASVNLAYLLLLSLSAKYVDNEKLYKIVNIINIIIVFIIIISLATGIVKNEIIYDRNRNTLGFVHVNYVGLLCYSIASLYILRRNKITIIDALIILLFSFVIIKISDSRTGCYAVVLLVLTYYLIKYCKPKYKKIFASIYSIIIFFFPLLMQLPFFNSNTINVLLTYRPISYQAYISSCSIRQLFFGGASSLTDCFYINALYGCGIFIYIIICVLFYKAIKAKINDNKDVEVSFILTTMLVGTMESSIMRPELLCIIIFWKLIIEEINY